MAYSAILLRVWALIPKWVLVGLAACFFAYYSGVSHGREPYRTAQKLNDAKQVLIVRHSKTDKSTIERLSRQANETIENNECIINDADARKLSDIRAD